MREELTLAGDDSRSAPTLRDLAAVLFRQKKVVLTAFIGTLVIGLVYGLLRPRYEGEMKFLVEKQRINPVVGPADLTAPLIRTDVTEEELNSEAEMLRDQDLLRQVVSRVGLVRQSTLGKIWPLTLFQSSTEEQIDGAVRRLQRHLLVEPVRRTNLVRVSYRSSDREESTHVLGTLMRLYLAKHTEVHRAGGQSHFFDQQARHYGEILQGSEQNMVTYERQANVVSAALERDLVLQKLTDFQASQEQIRTAITEAEMRIGTLQKKLSSTPSRETTQVKVADNPFLLQQLKSTLMNLQLKRRELLTKFQPQYRLVTEVDDQIADTKASIAAEELKPVREETTDRQPTYTWVEAELSKAQVDLDGLRGRATANQAIVTRYHTMAQDLGEQAIMQGALARTAKIAEDNYVLYQRKLEENRIGDALDEHGILNVMIAEPPLVPAQPLFPIWLITFVAVAVAGTTGAGCAFAADHLDPAFRTPDELAGGLGVAVLASLPRHGSAIWHRPNSD
jgi:uncharacterized protein involved in exopolysaccharide biosynthesis